MSLATELNYNDNRATRNFQPDFTGGIVADDMQMLAYAMWVRGPVEAHSYYVRAIQGGPTEVSVSHRVEAMAFEGTNWECLFEMLCSQ